jgi:F-type H+-transporting ATPase subunit b
MLIDWFTVIAQIINFLILVWLLKRFLYKPILKAVNEREKKIADQLNDAAMKEAEAQKEKNEFQQKNNEFDLQLSSLLNQAKEEAKDERKKLMEEARKEADALRLKFQESLKNQQQQLNNEIIQRIQKEVMAVSRKLLADLADITLEENMALVFLRKIKALKDEEKRMLSQALSSSNKVTIVSTYALTDMTKEEIKNTIKNISSSVTDISFETSSTQICGIDLNTTGYKLSWSISDYLQLVEKNAGILMKDQANASIRIVK